MSELKPCPFCGGTAELKQNNILLLISTTTLYKVKCTKCWCQTMQYENKKESIEMWNKRVKEVEE